MQLDDFFQRRDTVPPLNDRRVMHNDNVTTQSTVEFDTTGFPTSPLHNQHGGPTVVVDVRLRASAVRISAQQLRSRTASG